MELTMRYELKPSFCWPVLALDKYQHAYQIDFGADVKAYADAFMRNIDWKAVEAR
jgi:Fe-Mn family superoxide dismutase